MHLLFPNFNLEIVNMYEDSGNVFTILKMTGDNYEGFKLPLCVHKEREVFGIFIFDDTKKMAQAIKTI